MSASTEYRAWQAEIAKGAPYGSRWLHTPGPWAIGRPTRLCGQEQPTVVAYTEGGELCIGHATPGLPGTDMNAALFSAAPELLFALREMVTIWAYVRANNPGFIRTALLDVAADNARAVITKATGATHDPL